MKPAGPKMRVLKYRWLFKWIFVRALFGILNNEHLTASQVVLVLNNAIAIRRKRLYRAAARKAAEILADLEEGDLGSDDHQVMRFVLSEKRPFDMIKWRVTDAGRLLVYNPLRGLRPLRGAGEQLTTIHVPFDHTSFNFTKLLAERFAVVDWPGHQVGLYFNKYPYGAWHFVAVPDVDDHRPQIMTRDLLTLMWALGDIARRILPSLVVGYNSMGGRASIKQFHFHMIGCGTGRPGSGAPAIEYGELDAAWAALDRVQTEDKANNLIYADTLRIVARVFQGPVDCPVWNTGFACYELDGALIITDEAIFWTLTDEEIDAIYEQMCPETVRAAMAA